MEEGKLGWGRSQGRDCMLQFGNHALSTENEINWENQQKESVHIRPLALPRLLLLARAQPESKVTAMSWGLAPN